jgi:hypothetical protein
MIPEFTAHNIRLDDGTLTKPEIIHTMDNSPWFVSARRVLETVFPGDKKAVRLADLGCLEGGYAVEFARIGFQVLGVEVRESNIVACNYVKSKTKLENLKFVRDDAWNIGAYGMFDAIFCCGLLYHLDRPKEFIHLLSSATKKIVILQTHFATDSNESNKFGLSGVSENEGLRGRWYQEFGDEKAFSDREAKKWASWDNRRSFWIQREYLLQALKDAGFDLVMEQFDSLGPNIAENMTRGYYRTDLRGTFIGIKT